MCSKFRQINICVCACLRVRTKRTYGRGIYAEDVVYFEKVIIVFNEKISE